MLSADDFGASFEALTGNPPFPWQEKLFREFLETRFPSSCDLPTGLGKTSVIAVWLLALAHQAQGAGGLQAGFPRRLLYVVNRRTVVDQATRVAERMRESLESSPTLLDVKKALRSLESQKSGLPLAISTLRGQFADNTEWRMDPARPALVIGTIDMIGSRLLFSGYGCGFKSRPLHAGFLGQDALLVHDEAHLEPAFQDLVTVIQKEQERCREFRRFRVMAMTATSREGGERFQLTASDRKHRVVRCRLEAKKGLSFLEPAGKDLVESVAACALEHRESGQAILIFLRRLEDVARTAERLGKEHLPVQTLTGTMRGLERDALVKSNAIFARFSRDAQTAPQSGTVYLICTSAGEVGIDISADHLVCDLTPFDSMAQRFGRVNRFGDGDARIDVAPSQNDRKGDRGSGAEGVGPYAEACEATLALLRRLPKREDRRHDASPGALGELPAADRQAAFSPRPVVPAVSDILFDAWALTSIRQRMPGRPPVTEWLHGITPWEPPVTYLAWREEVERTTGELLESHRPEDLLDDYPLKPHELLRDATYRVHHHLEALAERNPGLPVWLVSEDGLVTVMTLESLAAGSEQRLRDATLVLPPAAGGLRAGDHGSEGILDGGCLFDEGRRSLYDVADSWLDERGEPRRQRIWDDQEPPAGMRLVRSIDVRPVTDDEPPETGEEGLGGNGAMAGHEAKPSPRFWLWFVRPRSADDDGSRSAQAPMELAPHLSTAERCAAAISEKLGLKDPEATAVVRAAAWHDLGKGRAIWQRSIRNDQYPGVVLAKPNARIRSLELNGYRHELGSLIQVSQDPGFRRLGPDVQELVLHFVGAHHGRARPHFPPGEVFDPEHAEGEAETVAVEAAQRFGRLQRKYGRWGLAFLESVVRAADALASQAADGTPVKPAGRTAPQALDDSGRGKEGAR